MIFQSGKSDGKVHEGEGKAIVQASLGGQGEAGLVLMVLRRVADLDVRGQHRIRGCQRGGQEQRGRQAEPEQGRSQYRKG
jgi:hypothetical protein